MLRQVKSCFVRSIVSTGIGSVIFIAANHSMAHAATSAAPIPAGFTSPVPSIINLVLALAVVVLLIYLLIRFLAKRSNVQQRGAISVLAARQVAPNRSVQVVQVQGKRYLLGIGEQVTLLADVSDSFEIDEDSLPPSTDNQSFGQVLTDALESLRQRYRSKGSEEDIE